MKGKKISSYAAALIITLFGVAATVLIVDTINASMDVANRKPIDPFDINTNFSTKKQLQEEAKEDPL